MHLATAWLPRTLCVLAIALGLALPATAQPEAIHYWNFRNADAEPAGEPIRWPSPIEANIGSGVMTHNFVAEGSNGVANFAGTSLNQVEDVPPEGSFSPQGDFNNGNSFVLNVPTTGFQNIVFSYATRGTSTGYDRQTIEYSIDGGTTYLPLVPHEDSRNTDYHVVTRDLSAIVLANNNPNFRIRVTVDGATSASGNNRFDNIRVDGTALGAGTGDGPDATVLKLDSVYPNPLSGRATVAFELPTAGSVSVAVYDVLGRQVAVLASGEHAAGPHRVEIDGTSLASGLYVVRLAAGEAVVTRRLTVAR